MSFLHHQQLETINRKVAYSKANLASAQVEMVNEIASLHPDELEARAGGCSLLKDIWLSQASAEEMIRDHWIYDKQLTYRYSEEYRTWVPTEKKFTYNSICKYEQISAYAKWHFENFQVWPPCEYFLSGDHTTDGQPNPIKDWRMDWEGYDLRRLPEGLQIRIRRQVQTKARKEREELEREMLEDMRREEMRRESSKRKCGEVDCITSPSSPGTLPDTPSPCHKRPAFFLTQYLGTP
jgi:hypothetical protein